MALRELQKANESVIDYAKWTMPRIEASESEPSNLTPAQRRVFWGIVSGRSLIAIAGELGVSDRTIDSHKQEIQRRIPGLLGFACYGALAMQIMNAINSQASHQPEVQ